MVQLFISDKKKEKLHNFDLLLKKSAKSNIDPVAVTIHGKPRSSKAVEKFG